MGAISANPGMKNQNYLCISVKTKQIDMRTADNEAHHLDGNDDKEPQAVCYAIDQQGGKSNCCYAKDVMVTLCSDSHGTPHGVCYSVDCRHNEINEEFIGTLQSHNVGGWSLYCTNPVMYEKHEE